MHYNSRKLMGENPKKNYKHMINWLKRGSVLAQPDIKLYKNVISISFALKLKRIISTESHTHIGYLEHLACAFFSCGAPKNRPIKN